jgi:hypothetical protein
MDELAKVVSEKTGLSMDQSKMAAQAVVDYIMSKLPAPMAQQMKDMMMGEGMMGGMGKMGDMGKTMDDMGKMMGDMGEMKGKM